MVELQNTGSLFHLPHDEREAAVVTTNGMLCKNGDAVMGKGQALEAKQLFPGVEKRLGEYLSRYGNRAFYMGVYQAGSHLTSLVTFPTKYHWRDRSSLELITVSAHQVKAIADKFHLNKLYMPLVGCGLGKLDYVSHVRPILQEILTGD